MFTVDVKQQCNNNNNNQMIKSLLPEEAAIISQKNRQLCIDTVRDTSESRYECESISNQPNLFPVEIHLFFSNIIAF